MEFILIDEHNKTYGNLQNITSISIHDRSNSGLVNEPNSVKHVRNIKIRPGSSKLPNMNNFIK